MKKVNLVVVPVLLACFACGSGDPGSPNTSSQASPQPTSTEPVYSRTIVYRNADGTEEVKRDTITASEQKAELAAAQARHDAIARGELTLDTLTRDSGCAGTDMWMFDQTGDTGDEICFYDSSSNPDYADLSNYCIYSSCAVVHAWWFNLSTNQTAVQSFYSGNQAGCFYAVNTGSYPFCDFNTYQDVTNVSSASCTGGSWASSLRYLGLNEYCQVIQ